MKISTRLSAVTAVALVASGLALLSPSLTSTAHAVDVVEVVHDGGFETAGNPDWTWSSGEPGLNPLCDPVKCPGKGAGAHTGTHWLWFSGLPSATRAASTRTSPSPSDAHDDRPDRSTGGSVPTHGSLHVTIDGVSVRTHAEGPSDPTYTEQTVDVSGSPTATCTPWLWRSRPAAASSR